MSGGLSAAHTVNDTDPWADANVQDVAILAAQGAIAALPETIQDTMGVSLVPDATNTVQVNYDDTLGQISLGVTPGVNLAGRVYVSSGGSGYIDSQGTVTSYIGPVDPLTFASDPAQPFDIWYCPGSGTFVCAPDGASWITISTYDPTKDPNVGGGTGTGVTVAWLDHPTFTQSTVYTTSNSPARISASGSTGSYVYSVDTLPAGLSLNSSTGWVTGTPTSPGSYFCTFTATSQTSSGAFTAPTSIGTGGRNGAGTGSFTVSPTGGTRSVIVGDLILFAVSSSVVASLGANWSVTDNLSGNTYQVDETQVQSTSAQTAIISCRIATAGTITAWTFTPGNSTSNIAISAFLVKGVLASGTYVDKIQNGGGTSATVTTSATATQTQSGNLAFAAAGVFQSAGTIGTTSPWNALTTAGSSSGTNDRTVTPEYQILSSTAAVSGAWTTATSGIFSSSIVTYKPGTGTSGGGASGSKGMTLVVSSSSGGGGTSGQYAKLGTNSVGGKATQTDGTPGYNAIQANLGTWDQYGHPYYTRPPGVTWVNTPEYAIINPLGLKPFITITNTDVTNINNGFYDSAYSAFFASLPSNAIVCLQHEPDHANKFTVAGYTSTFNRIAGLCKAANPSVKVATQFVAVNVSNGYPYAAGLNYTNIDYWGLDCYPSKGQTLANRVGAHYSYLTAMASKPLIFPEVGFVDDGTGGRTQQSVILESLKWLRGVNGGTDPGVLMYFVGQAGNQSSIDAYGLTTTQWASLKTSLDAGA